jgi:hypothetical protein
VSAKPSEKNNITGLAQKSIGYRYTILQGSTYSSGVWRLPEQTVPRALRLARRSVGEVRKADLVAALLEGREWTGERRFQEAVFWA